jgi:hypothetical protein
MRDSMRNFAMAALLLVGGCQQEEIVPPPKSYDGLLLEGTAEEAKGQGYRVCEPVASDHRYMGLPDTFTCKRDRPTALMGVAVDGAEVSLSYATPVGKALPDPATLSFDGVTLPLGVVRIDLACEKTDPADPNVCAFDGSVPMAQFERNLVAGGWKALNQHDERLYVKAGVLVRFQVKPADGVVVVGNVFQGFPEAMLKEIDTQPPVISRDPASERARVIEGMARD